MKTKEQSFLFYKEQVRKYVQLLGDENPVYVSEEVARSFGLQTIPLPPVMPMAVYHLFEIPWIMAPPVIHRKQVCVTHQQMFINETYKGVISLTKEYVRNGYTFSKQTLSIVDRFGNLCFSGTSHIVSGDVQ